MRTVTLAAALAFALSCAAGNHYAPRYSMDDVRATPPSLMVAQKLSRPLYLVLDPAKVQDAWELSGDAGSFELTEFHAFIERDLKQALSAYFEVVEVVGPGQVPAAEPHWIGDVKVEYVRLHDLVTGRLTYTTVEMSWGLGLRPSDADEYLVSFAGVGRSRESYRTFEEGAGQMVESAVSGMNEEWAEKDVLQTLKEHEAAAATAPVVSAR